MPLKTWKKISEAVLFRNLWWMYKKDEIELPNGKHGEYNYVHTNGSSMVVPVLSDGRIVFVKQYRYLNNRESLELPCGGVKDGHTYEETAKHELEEESGFAAQDLLRVGEFNPYNGITDELCRVFIARELTGIPPKPDETEEFEIIFLVPEEVDTRITNGTIWDGMTIASWYIAKPLIYK
jgi:ADP-ribose pyrophosphatase